MVAKRLIRTLWLASFLLLCTLAFTYYCYSYRTASAYGPVVAWSATTPKITAMAAVQTPTGRARPVQTAPAIGPAPTFMPVIFAHYRPQAQRLGIALEGFSDATGLQQTLALHPRWGRRWKEIAWRDIEPQEGEFHWEVLANLETELAQAAAIGLEPILEIQMTPLWAQKFPPSACGPIKPEKLGAFADFMEQMVKHYGTGSPYNVHYWQLGNELDVAVDIVGPDSLFGCWGDQSDPDYGGSQYAEMLKVVYPRIKAADARAQVMMGGLLLECDPYTMQVGVSCTNEERLKSGRFLEGVMKAGGGDFFDVVDVHSYGELRMDLPAHMNSYYHWSGSNGGTGLPEKVTFVRQVLSQYGHANKAIYAGEVALKCETASTDCDEAGAAFVPRVYAETYGLGLIGASYYALISDYKFKGLLHSDFTPKPAYSAYQFLSSQLHWVEYVGPATEYPGVSGQTFKRSGVSRLQILWSTTGVDQTVILPDDFVQAYDRYGKVMATEDGQLTVGWAPVYLQLKFRNQRNK